ncbi:MAG TPA: hypothetical protein VLH10_14540 [Yinghuangia sp.]|nr:hypothetical protein [Yinghuangia sp.]
MRKPYPTRIRTVLACLAFTALVAPIAASTAAPGAATGAAVPEPAPSSAVPTAIGVGDIAPRADPPDLVPDPDPNRSDAPGQSPLGHAIPQRPAGSAPSREERDALLAKVAPYGIVPVPDAAGAPALTADRELVLSGGPDGIDALRAAGLEVLPGPRPGVSAVRSGGRLLAWYLDDSALASTQPPVFPPAPEPSAVPSPPPTGLPDTGTGAAVPIGLVGLLFILAGAAVVYVTAACRPRRG